MAEAALRPPPLDAARVRGVIFDLDGTLIDSYGAIAASLNHARAGFDLPALSEEFVRTRVGRGLDELIAELVGPDRVTAGVTRFRERYAELFTERTRALPGTAETLAALRRAGYALAVASNKPARFSEPILDALGLRGWIGYVAGPDRVGSHKPEPAMLERCLDEMGLGRTEAIYVGDMVLDVESAARAGLPVVLVAGGSSTIDELRRTGQPTLETLEELPGLLEARTRP